MTHPAEGRCGYAAIVGRPNVGKSTLLNRLIGQKLAITSHKPQTTRHAILGIKTLEEGQVLYVDTPGLHQRGEQALNRHLNRVARSLLSDVDVIVLVVESLHWTGEDEGVLASVRETRVPVILAANKIDRVEKKTRILPFIDDLAGKLAFREVFPISARKGTNVAELEQAVVGLLPPGSPIFPAGQITDRPERFFAAELVREQLTRRYSQELPYAVAVEIEEFQEEGNLYRIAALVWVERSGQKKIIIGQDGAALKEVAQHARLEMEKLFGSKVYLSIWVKVKKSWSSDEAALASLGYGD